MKTKLSEDYGKRTKWHEPEEYNVSKIIEERDKYKAQRDETLDVEQALRAQRDELLTQLRLINISLNQGDIVLIRPGSEHHGLIQNAIDKVDFK